MKSKTSKTNATACALVAALPMLCGLTGCNTASRAASDSRQLYQPPVLRLEAGQAVQTPDGIYRPQVDEVWHSDARFRATEQAHSDALAALATERTRNARR